jgi:Family of unknown function (DUF6152)
MTGKQTERKPSMKIGLLVIVSGIGMLLAAPLGAHHAFSAEFDANRPIKLKGTVTQWELVNPHSWIHMDVKNEDGTVTNWMIEGGSPNALLRQGFTKRSLPPGTEIVVEGYQAKDHGNHGVGKNITFPDGKRLFLGGSANEQTEGDKK